MYRLYVDEVGTDDVGAVETDSERYLSLTGVAMRTDVARDVLTPRLNKIKAEIFNHDPDEPIIFHRKKIVKESGPFCILTNKDRRELFDREMMSIKYEAEYKVITALIGKKAMLKKEAWNNKHPYHYLMEVLVEKYARFLERMDDIGDIMPEGRMGKKDERLQSAYIGVRARGTYYVSRDRIQRRIPSSHLKFRYKRDNVAGLQLADLLAHPSHMIIRERMGHAVKLGSYCCAVKNLLMKEKYDRSNGGNIIGYGMKWLP